MEMERPATTRELRRHLARAIVDADRLETQVFAEHSWREIEELMLDLAAGARITDIAAGRAAPTAREMHLMAMLASYGLLRLLRDELEGLLASDEDPGPYGPDTPHGRGR